LAENLDREKFSASRRPVEERIREMEAPGTPERQIRGMPNEPPTQALVLHHEHTRGDGNDAMADPFESTARPERARKRRMTMTEGDPRPSTVTVETLVSVKESIVERAAEEIKELAQGVWKQLQDDWVEQRRAEEARRDSERKQTVEVLKAEMHRMLEMMKELERRDEERRQAEGAMRKEMHEVLEAVKGLARAGPSTKKTGHNERAEMHQPVVQVTDTDDMEVTLTGPRTDLELSKHAVNVHDRVTPAPPTAHPKNISKHALADLPSATPKASRPAEAPKATPKASRPAEAPKDAAPSASQAQPIPGLGAVRSPTQTYAGALSSSAPRQSEGEWKKIGSKGKVQKESSEDWPELRPLKPRNNPEDDRKIIFPRDGRTPHARHPMAITSEVNRALRRAGVADHIRVLYIKRNMKGILSGLVRADSNAQQLLHFKDLVLKAAREADSGIVGVESNETWAKVKIHGVSLERYMTETGPEGLQILREEIEAENPGVVIPTAPRWVGSVNRIMERWGQGEIRGSTVTFAIQDKRIAERLLATGLRAAGLRYKVERYAIEGPDAICANCSVWGHIAEKCDAPARCMYCAEDHPASQHHCLIPTCTEPKGPGHLCKYNKEKCANCGDKHIAQSGKCPDKQRAILAARDQRNKANLTTGPPSPRASPAAEPQLASNTEAPYDDSDGDRIMATADEPQL
jgi:hypothetical protein